ncbi:MAG: ATP-dependent helicase HrpB [Gammaproteobacteria bacterium]|nr:ATP-dependent helicase HrpB [Gammaproteobacteria bacterium]
MPRLPELPILAALPALHEALSTHRNVLLEAPPGAGKSTVVPLALLEAGWRQDGRILMLEPRRIAARAVAERMARLLGEDTGQTVGFRTRLETRVGPRTRVEVVTEGILTRMLQHDPALDGTACVVFDEFHERNLQGDLGLALCLESQRHLRDTLRMLVMSATLDGEALLRLLDDAVAVRSPGRMFDVETHYLPQPRSDDGRRTRIEGPVVSATLRALHEHEGDALLFLPGAGEIRRVVEGLAASLDAREFSLLPLYGELAAAEQDLALRPDPRGRRKVVVATNIAETSLTIDGVRIVVDSGVERRQRFDPATGMGRLETVRISRASADQRRGRAGRTAPGTCYRLWSESTQAALLPQAPAEILEADLAPLALELACWGCRDPASLAWLDPPPAAPLAQARDLLLRLEALDPSGQVTPLGRDMAALGLHPRLAHMVLRARALGLARLAAEIAALLSERDPLRPTGPGRDPDLQARLDVLRGRAPPAGMQVDSGAVRRIQRVLQQVERQLGRLDRRAAPAIPAIGEGEAAGLLAAFAYPDRIGRAREGGGGRYHLSGGRGAVFADATALARSEFIVVAALDAGEREARIQLAARLDPAQLEEHFAAAIEESSSVGWDSRSESVAARRVRRLGDLVLRDEPLRNVAADASAAAMLDGIRSLGLGCLPWTRDLEQWRARLKLVREHDPRGRGQWPDVGDAALLDTLDAWLGPWLDGITRRDQLAKLDLRGALHSLLDWNAQRRLDELAPTHLAVPSGSRIAVDYAGSGPSLSVRLQEVFGLMESPRVVDGRVPVTLELLSPARRPVQVTRDLASFWSRGYHEVRKELKGRYPKHYWPEDPHEAIATRRVRPRDGD